MLLKGLLVCIVTFGWCSLQWDVLGDDVMQQQVAADYKVKPRVQQLPCKLGLGLQCVQQV